MASVETPVTTAYKIVSVVKGKRLSMSYRQIDDPVEYKPGEWVEAPYGGLLVFEEMYDDLFDWYQFYYRELWEVSCEEPVPLGFNMLDTGLNCGMGWNGALAVGSWISLPRNWPSQTCAYKRVRLDKRIFPTTEGER